MSRTSLAAVLLALLATRPLAAQDYSTWLLAEGADNGIFEQEILIANPGIETLDVTVTLLPQADATVTNLVRTFTMWSTSRLTVRPGAEFGLNGSASARVTAVVARTATPADIVVERTMYFPNGTRAGAHSAGAVTQAAPAWTLAEGATIAGFDTFVLVASANSSQTLVRATYLAATGEQFVSQQVAEPRGRVTFWPRQEHPGLQAAEFSTLVESLTPGNDIVAERAMYFDGLRRGHAAVGVAAPSTTWYFAEGFTGGSAQTAFETFLLLANTGTAAAQVTVEYLLDSGAVVTRTYPVAARSRFTVWVDQEGRDVDSRLTAAAFGMRITSTAPIVAERAMYWGTPSAADPTTPSLPWRDGHASAGVTTPSTTWAFAEGQQGVFPPALSTYQTFFLIANTNPAPIAVRATFMREDGRESVHETCVGANARANIWTYGLGPIRFTELAGHRFATMLESVPSATCGTTGGDPFVAERATYLEDGSAFGAGHASAGASWPGMVPAPPTTPPFTPLGISTPGSIRQRLIGGRSFSLLSEGFQQGARLLFLNAGWTTDRNANTALPPIDEAQDVVVNQEGTVIEARVPVRTYATGYQTAGGTTIRVINPDGSRIDLVGALTFTFGVLAFGDELVTGQLDDGSRASRPFPSRLGELLAAYRRPLRNPASGVPTGASALQFGTLADVMNGGVPGECLTLTGGACAPSDAASRFPHSLLTSPHTGRAIDAVVILHGINDLRAGVDPGTIRDAIRQMLIEANGRGVVPIVAWLRDGTNLVTAEQLAALDAAMLQLAGEPLGFEVGWVPLAGIESGGAYPTQAGYDRIAEIVFERLVQLFPLQPCDARADLPGIGCPRNP